VARLWERSKHLLDLGEVLLLDQLHGLSAEFALEVVFGEELVGGDDSDDDDSEDKVSHF